VEEKKRKKNSLKELTFYSSDVWFLINMHYIQNNSIKHIKSSVSLLN